MPGSLDDLQFGIDGEEGGDIEEGNAYEEGETEDGEGEEATEEAFDEDFLATTQMKNVPFF